MDLKPLFEPHIPSYIEGIRRYALKTLLPRLCENESLRPISARVKYSDDVQIVLCAAVQWLNDFQV